MRGCRVQMRVTAIFASLLKKSLGFLNDPFFRVANDIPLAVLYSVITLRQDEQACRR